MSILLDAVTRSKQQELDSSLDPVLSPRAQYDQFSQRGTRSMLIALACLIVLLLGVIAWLSKSYFTDVGAQGAHSQSGYNAATTKSDEAERKEAKQIATKPTAALTSPEQEGISLAGKVALPIARQLPAYARDESKVTANTGSSSSSKSDSSSTLNLASQAKASDAALRQSVIEASQAIDSGSYQVSSEEPIILGANTNDKGQALLDSLKYQVNVAAEEVGMQGTDAQPRDYQSENNLLAAFEAALKEVEIENSVATPVTPEKLDPIPTTQPDELPKYGQLPAGIQLQVPEFNINAHVYSSVATNRWLNVDGNELQEGDSIGGKLTIVEIRPRDVVLSIQGTEFKVPAI